MEIALVGAQPWIRMRMIVAAEQVRLRVVKCASYHDSSQCQLKSRRSRGFSLRARRVGDRISHTDVTGVEVEVGLFRDGSLFKNFVHQFLGRLNTFMPTAS
jgi:hypothetical protein